MTKPAPKIVVYLLLGQFLGLFFLSVTTMFEKPILMFMSFSLGLTLLFGTIAVWVFLMLKEVREIKADVERIFIKKMS